MIALVEAQRAGLLARNTGCPTSSPASSWASSRFRWRWLSPSRRGRAPSKASTQPSSAARPCPSSAAVGCRSRARPVLSSRSCRALRPNMESRGFRWRPCWPAPMLVLMGLARMGGVIKFIPAQVIVGFTSGIGVIIFVGQWQDFLGLPTVRGDHFHEKLWHLVQVLPQVHAATLGLSLLSLALVLLSPRVKLLSRIPGL